MSAIVFSNVSVCFSTLSLFFKYFPINHIDSYFLIFFFLFLQKVGDLAKPRKIRQNCVTTKLGNHVVSMRGKQQ